MMKNKKIALVTGGNRGIGLEVCRQLASSEVQVILTARSEELGLQAQSNLSRSGFSVDFQRLDVTDISTLNSTFNFISKRYGVLDILINNAGILPDGDKSGLNVESETILQVFKTNTLGPLRLSQLFLPLLKKSRAGKIINISSGMGSLNEMAGGYPAYRISKAALNAVTLILSSEMVGLNIAVNSICPGWVKTDMGGRNAARSVEQGATGIVQLALLDKKVPTGKFLRDGQIIAW
ncbi:MAG: SDR family oxidoreductase [Nitrospirae bacterium]|nr:SDR family oxidoreductase [Nitrospirota bacterium]